MGRCHVTSHPLYCCSTKMKRRPCWCPKPILWDLNSFLVQTLFSLEIYIAGHVSETAVFPILKFVTQSYIAFLHDVTSAILVFQNNKTATKLVFQTSPQWVACKQQTHFRSSPIFRRESSDDSHLHSHLQFKMKDSGQILMSQVT